MSGKSPSLRRIQADIRELKMDPSDRYYAAPLENDMFEWHFTIRGADDTDFQGGIYHGRILLPPDYPFKPPHIIFLNESGRFDVHTKVCLSFSAYHPELWQPAWGIRLILEALISFLPTPTDGAIGAIDMKSNDRKKLATKSKHYCCTNCGPIINLIPKLKSRNISTCTTATTTNEQQQQPMSRFQKEILELQRLQMMSHPKEEEEKEQQQQQVEETTTTTKPDEEKQQQDAKTNTVVSENIVNETATTTTQVLTPMIASVGVNSSQTTTTNPNVVNDNSDITNLKKTTEGSGSVITSNTIDVVKDITETLSKNEERKIGKETTTTTTSIIKETLPKKDDDIEDISEQKKMTTENDAIVKDGIVPNVTPVVDISNNSNTNDTILPIVDITETSSTSSLVTRYLDPFLQWTIFLLSILCCLLLHKIQMLVLDINELYNNNDHNNDHNEL